MEKITDRIKNITEYERISIRQLEIAIGCSNGVLSKAIKRGTDINSIWVSKIIEIYEAYDPGWLLTGKGEMIKTQGSVSHEKTEHPENIEIAQVLEAKNEIIASLRQQIKIQADYIESLKAQCSQKISEQKRKAG